MKKSTEEFQKMQSEYLNRLISLGRNYTGIIDGAATTLRYEYLGKIQLSEDEKEQLFNDLTDTVKKHAKLIEQSVKELQDYFDAINRESSD